MQVRVSVRGGVEWAQALRNANLAPTLQAASIEAGQQVETLLHIPPGPSNSPVIWQSAKQRRWYFAARRKAGLPIHYTRNSDAWSHQLEASWTTTPWRDTSAVVGTPVAYAPFVQGMTAARQAQHIATGWGSAREALERVKATGAISKIFQARIKAYCTALSGRNGGEVHVHVGAA